MRLFVAADLPPSLRAALAGVQRSLEGLPLPVRWVRPEGIHLTFKFLGEIDPPSVAAIEAALRRATDGLPAFRLIAGGIGVFPDRGQPRVVWVGVGGDVRAAARLRDAIEEVLAGAGVARETNEFRPHLTLGRVKGPARGDWRAALAAAPVREEAFAVDDCILFQSAREARGTTYLPLARFPLSGAPA